METTKLIVAIDLNPVEKQALHCITYGLRAQCKTGRINPEEMYHVTLHYFEQVPRDRIKDILNAVNHAAAGQTTFPMVTGKPGKFGPDESAVVWINIQEGLSELGTLHDRIEKQLVRAGFLEDIRPFQPHVTVGREIDIRGLTPKLGEFLLPSMSVTARGISLLESKLQDGKPYYETLATLPFLEGK